jgi:hypothetical protein
MQNSGKRSRANAEALPILNDADALDQPDVGPNDRSSAATA